MVRQNSADSCGTLPILAGRCHGPTELGRFLENSAEFFRPVSWSDRTLPIPGELCRVLSAGVMVRQNSADSCGTLPILAGRCHGPAKICRFLRNSADSRRPVSWSEKTLPILGELCR